MIKRIFLLTLVVLLCGLSYAQKDNAVAGAKLIAHGGYWKSSNTAPGSKEALEAALRFGCYASECKVSLTTDHEWVVIVNIPARRSNWDNVSSEQLRQMGANFFRLEELILDYQTVAFSQQDKKDPKTTKAPRPSSSQQTTKLMLNFQGRVSDSDIASLTTLLDKVLIDIKLRQTVEFSSSNILLCLELNRKYPDIQTTYLKGDRSPRDLAKKGFTGCCAYDVPALTAHPKWVREAASHKMPLCATGVENAGEVRQMLSLGVDRILTDDLAQVDAWVQGKPVVKLMSFNIRMSGMPKVDGDNAWENRKDAVVEMLKVEDPDVLGVQEMLPDQQKFLRQKLSGYEMVGVGRDDGRDEGECMGVFYKKDRFELEKSGTFWLSQTPDKPSLGWDAACKRTVTYVQLKERTSGKKFFYFNTHLDHVGRIARQESIVLLIDKIRNIVRDPNSIVILGGDMNSALSDPIFTPLLSVNSKSSKPSLVITPASASLMVSCRNSAWQKDNCNTYTGYGKDKATQIDHILATPVTENLIFQTVNHNFGVPYLSDHYPITITFTLR